MTARRSRPALACLGIGLLLFAPGCASAGGATAAESASAPGERDIAQSKVRVAELELEHARKASGEEQAQKAGELGLATAELGQFDEVDAPERSAREALALTRSQDALLEQEEELAQLELTYAEVDLADKTREIVLQRNHRRVERAKSELTLAERGFAQLQQNTLPRERAKLALAVAEKTAALESTQRSAEIDMLEKQVALAEARAAFEKLEKEKGTEKSEKPAAGSAP
ncbi:MAG: hypothetical protein EXS08_15055 [Planctomycetes bacterium]|nr:hypothetical protein [Planctomycetota bacterium]